MDTIVTRAAGLDVHKAQVTACVRVPGQGRARVQEVAEFATTVRGLLSLRDWLKAHRATQVAMEATGVYWKPVWAILEDTGIKLDCVATDILGASGRAMLDALAAGTTADRLGDPRPPRLPRRTDPAALRRDRGATRPFRQSG